MKKAFTFFAVLALIVVPLAFASCGNGAMTFADYQALEVAAAKSFKAAHTEYATFSDITYCWAESSTEKEIITLYYNKVAEGSEYTTGTFENEIVETRDCSLAVKKTESSLVAKLMVNSIIMEKENIVDALDNDQHKIVITITTTQEVFYVTPATKGDVTVNVVAHYKSTQVNNDAAVITKEYEEAASPAALTNLIKDYALNYANASVAHNFFEYDELLIYPFYDTSLTKSGNQVKYTFAYSYANIDASLNWGKTDVSGTVLYDNGKLFKTQMSSKSTTENTTEETSSALSFSDLATVEDINLAEYTEEAGIIELYRNSCQTILG